MSEDYLARSIYRLCECSPDMEIHGSACSARPHCHHPGFWRYAWKPATTLLSFAFSVLLLGFADSLQAQNYNPNNLDAVKTMQEIQHPHSDLVILSSHRGNHALVNGLYPSVPENSLQAIGLSAQSGIEEIELDIKLTSDGIPILSHDLTWGREWCGLSPFPYGAHFNPFIPLGNTGNDLANPAVSATSLSNTRSILGTTILRDTVSLINNTGGTQGCVSVASGVYPPTLQDALNFMTQNKIAMVLSLDIRDAPTANAAWQVINNNTDYLGRNYLLETLFKIPGKAFASPRDVETTLPAGPGRYPAYFQPVYNTGDIAPGDMPANETIFGGVDVGPAPTGYGSESAIIQSLQAFENDSNITVAAVEVQIKQIGGILTSFLAAAKTNSRTGQSEAVSVFSPYVDYWAPSDTNHTNPLFFQTNSYCCVNLASFYYNGAPYGQPSDTADNRGDLSYLMQQGFNSITYDNPANYASQLAALGKRNISYLQATGGTGKRSIVPLRVMPIGDSITEGFQSTTGNGYRYPLQQDIEKMGQTIEFVGDRTDGTMTNPQNEGFSGQEIAYIAGEAIPSAASWRPNVALILAGTNDINKQDDMADAPGRLDSMINGLFTSAPDATIIVAGIPPSFDPTFNTNLQVFNLSVQSLVANRQNAGQHIEYVSMSNLDPNADKADSLHPNDAGYQIVGNNFAGAIEDVMNKGWVTPAVAINRTVGGGSPGIAKEPVGPQPGLGTMTSLGVIASGIGADPKTSFVQFADIDGDGKADYLSIDANGATTVYFSRGQLANGGWDFVPLSTGLLASGIGDPGANVRFADIDGDGRADYLTVSASGTVRAYLNKGARADGSINWVPAPYANQVVAGGIGAPGSTIRFGDINGDGFADYLSVSAAGAVTGYLNGGPNPNGSGWIWYPVAGQIAGGVGAPKGSTYLFADINNDGWADYIVIDAVNGTVHAWVNGGRRADGSWIWYPQGQIAPGIGSPSKLNMPTLADINGDGKADYLAINYGGSVYAALNNGKDTSSVAGWLPIGPIANAAANIRWADIDGDGLADYITVDLTSGAAYAYLNGGRKADGSWIWYPQNQIAGGECGAIKTCYIEFADIDGDGKADYIVGDYTSAYGASVWLSGGVNPANGQWIWYPQGQSPLPSEPTFPSPDTTVIRWADVNGDGYADETITTFPATNMVALLNTGPSSAWTSQYRLNTADEQEYSADLPSVVSVWYVDMNGDGTADRVEVYGGGSINVEFSTSAINGVLFTGTSTENYASGAGAGAPGSQIQFGDINGDGKADYLIVPPTGSVTAWLNNGGNTYQAKY